MRPDLDAATRLFGFLPVHTHEQKAPVRNKPNLGNQTPARERPRRRADLFGRGGKARAVKIGNALYESVGEASRVRHKSKRLIYQWLRTGDAEYA